VIRALSSSFSLGENYELSLAVVSATCGYSVDAASKSFDATGGTGSVNVIADASCPWLAKPDADWVTVTAGASGNGNGNSQQIAISFVDLKIVKNAEEGPDLQGQLVVNGQTIDAATAPAQVRAVLLGLLRFFRV
jgi:hypothetical protein